MFEKLCVEVATGFNCDFELLEMDFNWFLPILIHWENCVMPQLILVTLDTTCVSSVSVNVYSTFSQHFLPFFI